MPLPVTALYAGLMGLWPLGLGYVIVRRRRRHDVLVGDGGVRALELAMRAHGNACEYVPVALILLGLAEGLGAPGWVLLVFGSMLGGGRLLHGGYFLTGADEPPRSWHGADGGDDWCAGAGVPCGGATGVKGVS